jgi:hypothetical protein
MRSFTTLVAFVLATGCVPDVNVVCPPSGDTYITVDSAPTETEDTESDDVLEDTAVEDTAVEEEECEFVNSLGALYGMEASAYVVAPWGDRLAFSQEYLENSDHQLRLVVNVNAECGTVLLDYVNVNMLIGAEHGQCMTDMQIDSGAYSDAEAISILTLQGNESVAHYGANSAYPISDTNDEVDLYGAQWYFDKSEFTSLTVSPDAPRFLNLSFPSVLEVLPQGEIVTVEVQVGYYDEASRTHTAAIVSFDITMY